MVKPTVFIFLVYSLHIYVSASLKRGIAEIDNIIRPDYKEDGSDRENRRVSRYQDYGNDASDIIAIEEAYSNLFDSVLEMKFEDIISLFENAITYDRLLVLKCLHDQRFLNYFLTEENISKIIEKSSSDSSEMIEYILENFPSALNYVITKTILNRDFENFKILLESYYIKHTEISYFLYIIEQISHPEYEIFYDYIISRKDLKIKVRGLLIIALSHIIGNESNQFIISKGQGSFDDLSLDEKIEIFYFYYENGFWEFIPILFTYPEVSMRIHDQDTSIYYTIINFLNENWQPCLS